VSPKSITITETRLFSMKERGFDSFTLYSEVTETVRPKILNGESHVSAQATFSEDAIRRRWGALRYRLLNEHGMKRKSIYHEDTPLSIRKTRTRRCGPPVSSADRRSGKGLRRRRTQAQRVSFRSAGEYERTTTTALSCEAELRPQLSRGIPAPAIMRTHSLRR